MICNFLPFSKQLGGPTLRSHGHAPAVAKWLGRSQAAFLIDHVVCAGNCSLGFPTLQETSPVSSTRGLKVVFWDGDREKLQSFLTSWPGIVYLFFYLLLVKQITHSIFHGKNSKIPLKKYMRAITPIQNNTVFLNFLIYGDRNTPIILSQVLVSFPQCSSDWLISIKSWKYFNVYKKSKLWNT